MCGRYTLTARPQDLVEAFDVDTVPEEWVPRFNVAPTQPVAVIANRAPREVQLFRWGLIPSWAKDEKIGYRMINARADTAAQKPAFRKALRKRRCLVLADGFYEWQSRPGPRGKPVKHPYYIGMQQGQPFAFAGLWESWYPREDERVRSCTILTTEANALCARVHDRMPVILPRSAWAAWLNPEEVEPEELQPLLVPYDPGQMTCYPVSTLVNSPAHDAPECLVRLDAGPGQDEAPPERVTGPARSDERSCGSPGS